MVLVANLQLVNFAHRTTSGLSSTFCRKEASLRQPRHATAIGRASRDRWISYGPPFSTLPAGYLPSVVLFFFGNGDTPNETEAL